MRVSGIYLPSRFYDYLRGGRKKIRNCVAAEKTGRIAAKMLFDGRGSLTRHAHLVEGFNRC